MSRRRTSKGILREVTDLQRELRDSQRDACMQFSTLIVQFQRQADSMFDGQTWAEASELSLADRLGEYITALTELNERLASGEPPTWKQAQDAAFDASELGKLLKDSNGREEANE